MGDDEDKKRPRKIRLLDKDLTPPAFDKIVPKTIEFRYPPSDAGEIEIKREWMQKKHLAFTPISPYEQAIVKWLNENYGVEVLIGEYAAVGPLNSKRIYVEPDQDESTLCHESSHAWLNIKKKFFDEPLHDIKNFREYLESPEAKKYEILDSKVDDIVWLEHEIDTRGDSQYSKLTNALGSGYLTIRTVYSSIGNLVKETETLGKPAGHPMDNFHEFFASSMTTLIFDGEVFFRLLREFKTLSERKDCPDIKKIYDKVMDLLSDVHQLGTELYQEQSKYLWKFSRERSTLESNLEKLGKVLADYDKNKEPEKKKLLR